METKDENDDDISEVLNNLFEPLDLNSSTTGARPKEPPEQTKHVRNLFTNWRAGVRNSIGNQEENNVTNSWSRKSENDTRKWTWQHGKNLQSSRNKDTYPPLSQKTDTHHTQIVRRPPPRSELNLSLQEILKMESNIPEQVIVSLVEKIEQFKRIIGGDLSFQDVVLLLRVFEKICSSHFDENRGKLITSIVNAKFHNKILEYLLLLATQSTAEKIRNNFFWENPERFWNSLLIFYENIFEFMPNTAADLLPKIVKATVLSINDMEKFNEFNLATDVKKKLMNFQEKLTNLDKQEITLKVQEPPDSFRLLNIYPSVEEITTEEVPFIRPIIKNGAYQSVEHYLDVQFRLMKEDFTASLRNGIYTYLQNENKAPEHQFDVRIYEKVQFLAPHVVYDRVASLLQYADPANTKLINECSKRFIYGSLLCFTSDSFQSISFGIVIDSSKHLQRGQIIVDIKEGSIDFNKKYTMVECTVFFEPYYQVLTAMKKIDKDNFPFKDYIIDVTSKTKPPNYITNSTIADFKEDKYKFRILAPETWPKPKQVGLNESQFKAFQSALTQEFCIIQGPPGTGKTFTTLRIVEFLLRNMPTLRYQGPIFVICFTNHALDQFLEGIVNFTENILRIGGQSKSEIMKNYSLQNYRDILKCKVKRARKIARIRHQKRKVASFYEDIADDYYNFSDYLFAYDLLSDDDYHPDEHKYNFSDYVNVQGNQISTTYFNNMEEMKEYESLLNTISSLNGIIGITTLRGYEIINPGSQFYGKLKYNRTFFEWLLENDELTDFENIQDDQNQNENTDIWADIQNELFGARILVDDSTEIDLNVPYNSKRYLTIKDYQTEISKYERKLLYLETLANDHTEVTTYETKEETEIQTKSIASNKHKIEHKIFLLRKKQQYLSRRLRECRMQTEIIPPNMNVSPESMTPNERWNLYRYWLSQLRAEIHDKISSKDEEFRRSHKLYQEIAQLRDIYIMQKMHVIGMTTTGAARHQKLLQILKCPIVIAEEAAEVLESHIVVALTKHCQHLILIGDHQQLRPNTAQYNLAKKYNLDISLFERMVQNGIHCQRLNIQHRMRPEFAKLLVPAIYPDLENYATVENLPSVRGVNKNLFFINHSVYEDHITNSSSHQNIFEGKFILNLASYFIKQGYKSDEITILTTYKGQMYMMCDERKRHDNLKDVRITVVDNFQGEENKIILLSLVRSNPEANIGFLKTENRVCVALSRAKEGFFIIGNMDNLQRSSAIWPKINKALAEQNAIGDSLTLQCQEHSTRTIIRNWEDFGIVSEGGCSIPCNTTLNCNHICKLKCHPYDREHKEYKCKENCTRKCPQDHPCFKLCYEDCPPCLILIPTDLFCGHRQSIPCSIEVKEYKCKAKVTVELPCGHIGSKHCYEDPKVVKCLNPCEKVLDCGHIRNYECHERNNSKWDKYLCEEPCTKYNKGCSTSEHICQLKCHEECLPCSVLVKKRRVSCTHKVRATCSEEIGGSICRENCRKILSCGHHCPKLCYEECGDCPVMVTKIKKCGHSVTTQCKNELNGEICDQHCNC